MKTLPQVFSYEFCEVSKNTFSYRTPPVATFVLNWLITIWFLVLPEQLLSSLDTESFSHRLFLFQNYFIGKIFDGQKSWEDKYPWNLFSRYYPQTAKLNSEKMIEIGSIAKICFAKFNFSTNISVCLAVTVEQLYNKD